MISTQGSSQSPFVPAAPVNPVAGGPVPGFGVRVPQLLVVDTAFYVFWLTSGMLIALGAVLIFWMLFGRRMVRVSNRSCPKCRYDMVGVSGMTCPECGRTVKSERRLARPGRRWGLALVGLLMISTGFVLPLVARGGSTWVMKQLPNRVLVYTWAVMPGFSPTVTELSIRLQTRGLSPGDLRSMSRTSVRVLSTKTTEWPPMASQLVAAEAIVQAGHHGAPSWTFLRETYWHTNDPLQSANFPFGNWTSVIRIMIEHDPTFIDYVKNYLEPLALGPRFDFLSSEAYAEAMNEERADRAVLALRMMKLDQEGRLRETYPLVAKLLMHPHARVRDAAKELLLQAGTEAETAIITEAGNVPGRFVGYFLAPVSQRPPTISGMLFMKSIVDRPHLPYPERITAARLYNRWAKDLGMDAIAEPMPDAKSP